MTAVTRAELVAQRMEYWFASRLRCGNMALQFASYRNEVLDSCAHNEPGTAFILRRYRDKWAVVRFP